MKITKKKLIETFKDIYGTGRWGEEQYFGNLEFEECPVSGFYLTDWEDEGDRDESMYDDINFSEETLTGEKVHCTKELTIRHQRTDLNLCFKVDYGATWKYDEETVDASSNPDSSLVCRQHRISKFESMAHVREVSLKGDEIKELLTSESVATFPASDTKSICDAFNQIVENLSKVDGLEYMIDPDEGILIQEETVVVELIKYVEKEMKKYIGVLVKKLVDMLNEDEEPYTYHSYY